MLYEELGVFRLPFPFQIVLAIVVFARNATVLDLGIEPRPVSMQRAKMGSSQ